MANETLTPENRAKLIKRVRALFAMSNQTESSPREAAAALKRYRALMDEYGFTAADLNVSEFGESVGRKGRTIPKWFKYLGIAVAAYNDCVVKGYRDCDGIATHTFKGYETDVMLATLMVNYLEECMDRGWKRFSTENNVKGRAAHTSFNNGFALEMQHRLDVMTDERKIDIGNDAATGQSLIVIKMDLVNEEYGKQKISRRKSYVSDEGSYAAGVRTAQNTSLASQINNRPVAPIALGHSG